MTDSELTLAVLREIRDEIRATNTRLDTTNSRLDTTNERIEAVRVELKAEISITNERLALVEETLKDLAGQQVILTRYVSNIVDRQEQAIADIRERLVRLETRAERS